MNLNKLLIALSLLIPSIALAEFPGIVNSSQATLYGSQQESGPLSMDTKGNLYVRSIDPSSGLSQSVIPVSNNTSLSGVAAGQIAWINVTSDTVETSSTTTVINATTHSARVGDVVYMTSGTAGNVRTWSPVKEVTANTITLSNALPVTPANADGFLILRPEPVVGGFGSNGATQYVEISTAYQSSAASGILKQEDAAHTTGDAGISILGVQNDSFATLAATGDYIPLATGRAGNNLSSLVTDDILPFTRQAVIVEDAAVPAGAAAVLTAAQAVSAIAQTVGTTGDAAPPAMDLGNRQVVTFAPAGETWAGCSSAATGTSNTQIKAAVASNRIYVTSVSCTNTSTVDSEINFKDGTGYFYTGYVNGTTKGYSNFQTTFPTPLRGSVNTAFNFSMTTTATSTICCAAGYISTI